MFFWHLSQVKPPKAKPRFHGSFVIVKKLDKGAVIIRLQDCSEEIFILDRYHTLKTAFDRVDHRFRPKREKNMSKSTALLPATRIQVAGDQSQVSRIGSVPVEPQVARMEEGEGEISLVSDITTQDTEMSQPPTYQEDFFVWIKNLDSHVENRESFSWTVKSIKKILLVQIFQESEIVFRATVTINTISGLTPDKMVRRLPRTTMRTL